jgi:vesicle coat complex subunit
MKLIKNNKVTTINTLEDVQKLKQEQSLTEKIHKAHDNVELLLQHLTNASNLLKELGISAIMINDNHNVFGTIIGEKYYEGLVIKVDDRIFQIFNN